MSEITSRLSTTLAGLRDRKPAVVKVLRPGLSVIFGGGRFLNEIKVGPNLQHPNIRSVHDSGEAKGQEAAR